MANAGKRVDKLTIENAKIGFRNFSGSAKEFNPAGNRNFCVFLDADLADRLASDGWNIKRTKVREEGDEPSYFVSVAVKYDNFPPKIWMVVNGQKTLLTEDTVGTLDSADIENVDLVINPYVYNVNGKSGIKAYCQTMYVTIQADPFMAKYDDEDF